MRRCSAFVAVVAMLVLAGGAPATASTRAVTYHGYRLNVPAGWRVFNLAHAPRTCVRFDRHAVYLGLPSARQDCPAHAAGRTGAVLVSPGGGAHTAAGPAGVPSVATSGGRVDTVVLGTSGLVATATWSGDRARVARLLGHALAATRAARLPAARLARARGSGPTARAAEAVFTGFGFDACSAPSASAMSAWGASPYRAVGVYIGGANSSCAQPNLSSTWVATEAEAGWHLIPTYVGLQGAGSCGGSCATIDPSNAGAQGAAAAQDAISHAEALGIPQGNPIYDDMEQYSRSTANTTAVLAFLQAWTSTLHAGGYESGVYSSALGAITDLVNEEGSGYDEPDDIWIGDWNNSRTTSDPYVPSTEWTAHQRIHQYQGGHNETYGGVTLDIDSDDVDAATADTASGSGVVPPVPDGTFVEEEGTTTVYRVAGGAPLLVTSWDPYGGPQPVTTLTAEQFADFRPYPSDGTFVQTTNEANYRFAGGAPFGISSWSVFGGIQPYVVIDAWNIANAGNPQSHVNVMPVDGTVVEGLPSGSYWVFCGGLRAPTAANAEAVQVDDVGLAAYGVGTDTSCLQETGAGTLAPKTIKPVKYCTVPRLKHMTLTRARRALTKANCRVGKLRKPRHVPRHHTLHVYGQSAGVRSKHPNLFHVNLWLK